MVVNTYQVGLYMPIAMVEALDAEAIRRDISRAELIREACRDKLAAAPKPRKRKRGDEWAEFVAALARVVKPAHRPAVEQLTATLRQPKLVPPPAAA